MSLGERIRERRTKLGLSQVQLANKIGTGSDTISRWETDKIRISQKYISKLAKALNTSTDYLLGETDNSDLCVEDNAFEQDICKTQNSDIFAAPQNCAGRLVIKQGDLYINLPETPEGYSILKTLLNKIGFNDALSPSTEKNS